MLIFNHLWLLREVGPFWWKTSVSLPYSLGVSLQTLSSFLISVVNLWSRTLILLYPLTGRVLEVKSMVACQRYMVS